MAIFTGVIIIWYYLTREWMLSESYKHGVLYSLRICKWKLTLYNHQRTYFILTLRGKKAMDYAADDTLDSEEFLQVDNLLTTRCWGRCPFDIHNYLPLGVFPLLSIELIEFMIILREMLPNVKDVTHLTSGIWLYDLFLDHGCEVWSQVGTFVISWLNAELACLSHKKRLYSLLEEDMISQRPTTLNGAW